MNRISKIAITSFLVFTFSCSNVKEPAPIGPIPTQRQLDWQEMEYYAFIHFNMNTFTDMEWGTGGESPKLFNPTQLDARQWAKVAKDAGMKGIIITAKHHDGFCLWPTETTEHSVKNSPWKDGKGDVIKELAEACEEFGLKMGVYLSPWDRNHAEYGREEYVAVFHKQLEELLTNYGDIFEVWFDGANGGTGYYGGANENRKIDAETYYQWDKVTELVRKHQPGAVIFSDNGPGVRWVGNEHGFAGKTNWSIIRRAEVYPGSGKHKEMQFGHEDGTHWVPAEADVSIRPGWYYHKREDHLVKSLPDLLEIYYKSVGRNAALLLNLPVDRRGLVHEKDVEQLMKLRQKLDEDFETNLAVDVETKSTNTRGGSSKYDTSQAIDKDKDTYWATDDEVTQASVTLNFEEPTSFNRFLVQEYIPLGQRVQKFTLEAEIDGKWQELEEQTTIGYKRILRFDAVTATKVRLNIIAAKGPPLISTIEIYNAPLLLVAPEIQRSKAGEISLNVPDKNVEVYYTLNGNDPDKTSKKYSNPFKIENPATLKTIAFNPGTEEYSEINIRELDIPKKNWTVIGVSSGNTEEATKIIDENSNTWWSTNKDEKLPQEVIIDLGKEYSLKGFTYYPPQDRWSFGIVSHYEFLVSTNNQDWTTAASGEFGNIKNNPIEQKIDFQPIKGRYIKLRGVKTVDGNGAISIGEIGVITSDKN